MPKRTNKNRGAYIRQDDLDALIDALAHFLNYLRPAALQLAETIEALQKSRSQKRIANSAEG